jgi:uncharacterized membrane protein YdbT with pleckstrin-like domain
MTYLAEIIQPGETVRHTGRLHWIIYLRGAAMMIGFAILYVLASSSSLGVTPLMFVLTVFAEFVGLALLVDAAVRQATTEIFVTDRRAILKTGFIARRTFEMNMDKIESVDVSQSILGRMLDYGTVVLRGTGQGVEPLKTVSEPVALRKAVTAS